MYTLKTRLSGALLAAGLLLMAESGPVQAQSAAIHEKQAAVDSVITAKSFPLLAVLRQDADLQHIIQKDKALRSITAERYRRVSRALQECKETACYAEAMQWSTDEINRAGAELIRLYRKKRAFRILPGVLRKKGAYPLYGTLTDTAFLRNVWNHTAGGVNYILDIYIKGKTPRYPKIDAIDFQPDDAGFRKQVHDSFTELAGNSIKAPFFELPLRASLFALQANGRDEAARYEPLAGGMNSRPFLGIKNIKWPSYRYSMILVPGLGPEITGLNLDPGGAKRCEEAVKRFREGLAPFIVVSGGHVHPNKTPYCEAVEMKKYLVEKLGIPDSVVFTEPHARHTTTNLRNVNRMIYRFGIPPEKPVLIVTDTSQSSYIVDRMAKTAMRDLGYLPYRSMKKLGQEDTEYYPEMNSLQADPLDPLDP